MKPPITFILGFRFLIAEFKSTSSRLLFLVSLLGMSVGLSTFLVGQSVLTTFQNTYLSSILGFNAHLVIINTDGQKLDVNQLLPDQFKEKYSVSHYYFQDGVFLSPSGLMPVMIKGVSTHSLSDVYQVRYKYTGEKKLGEVSKGVLLGKKLYDAWQTKNNAGNIRIILNSSDSRMSKLDSISDGFEVLGYFESGLLEFDSRFILTSDTYFADRHQINEGYEIKISEPERAIELARQMEDKFPSGVTVIPWQELNSNLFEALKMEKTVFLLVMSVIVVVATLNIGGILLMLLYKKKTDLMILACLGLSGKQMRHVLLFQSAIFSILSSLVALTIALGLLYLLNYMKIVSLDPQVYQWAQLEFGFSIEAFFLAFLLVLTVSMLIAKMMSTWVIGSHDILKERNT